MEQGNGERNAPPSVLVIFGASGDLTRRKLVPALESLAEAGRLPARSAVVGVGRTPMSDGEFRTKVLDGGGSVQPALTAGYRYLAGGYDDPDTYRRLSREMIGAERAVFVRLRDGRYIDDEMLRTLLRRLDLEEAAAYRETAT